MQQQQKEKPPKKDHKQRRTIASKEKERDVFEERLNRNHSTTLGELARLRTEIAEGENSMQLFERVKKY